MCYYTNLFCLFCLMPVPPVEDGDKGYYLVKFYQCGGPPPNGYPPRIMQLYGTTVRGADACPPRFYNNCRDDMPEEHVPPSEVTADGVCRYCVRFAETGAPPGG